MSALPLNVPVRPATAVAAGTARPLDIPSPRTPSDRSVRSQDGPAIRIPSPRVPVDVAGPAANSRTAEYGRHRAAVARMSPGEKALLVAGRAGSLTTLAALLVMSAAFAGVLDGSEPTGPAAQVATTTLR